MCNCIGVVWVVPTHLSTATSLRSHRPARNIYHWLAIESGTVSSHLILVSQILCMINLATKTTGDSSPNGSNKLCAKLNICRLVGIFPNLLASFKSAFGWNTNWSDSWFQNTPRAFEVSELVLDFPIAAGVWLKLMTPSSKVCNSLLLVVHFSSSILASPKIIRASLMVFAAASGESVPPIQSSTYSWSLSWFTVSGNMSS